MSRLLPALAVVLSLAGSVQAAGLLIPAEKKLPPLALVSQQVNVDIDDQVAVTRVEQSFRNHTNRDLEATYVFPVPKGASVREFAMWVEGKKISGDLVEADEARKIYTEIVQRTQDPGLLEYIDANLFRLKVFPVPANKEQKISLSYTSVAESDHGVIEYRYPLKTDARLLESLDRFTLAVQLKSQHRVQSVYSPSHAVTIARSNDREARVSFEKGQTLIDRDFSLFYTTGDKDVGLTVLTHRPYATHDGHFLLLISPRAELSESQQAPRDVVFVLDTSGSMMGKRIVQARNALKFCLSNLGNNDRFAVLHFASAVNKHGDRLEPATADNTAAAKAWVDRLDATGGTAIQAALLAALEMRSADKDRTFTIVFFTDGKPTIGEIDVKKIQANVLAQNSTNTRLFTFGVGDDVNTTLLDGLAEQSRAVASYVREQEDIEEKVSNFYSKINHPVLTNLRLNTSPEIKLSEVYPAELPDLFHGAQLTVLGRYSGDGDVTVTLTGNIGKESREFTYKAAFPKQAKEEKRFVEDLWARRKVGYLLDQIRRNGEVKELKDEVIRLAKRHGIATPYTSYLVVPDEVARQAAAQPGRPNVQFAPVFGQPQMPMLGGTPGPTGGARSMSGSTPIDWVQFYRNHGYQINPGGGAFGFAGGFGGAGSIPANRPGGWINSNFPNAIGVAGKEGKKSAPAATSAAPVAEKGQGKDKESAKKESFSAPTPFGDRRQTSDIAPADPNSSLNEVRKLLADGRATQLDSGKVAVDLALYLKELRTGNQAAQAVVREVSGRSCVAINGAWIDEGFTEEVKTVTVKSLSKGYFRILERQPQMRDVFALGNFIIWITPSGEALIIDLNSGVEELADAEIDRLFAVEAKKEK